MRLYQLKTLLITVIASGFVAGAHAQTVFTYGNHAVSNEEFMKAWQKNNHEPVTSEKSMQNYLELYIRYKLKVQAAKDAQLDTIASQQAELTNFRNQVVENYMKDDESLARMEHEAFLHAQKDIQLAHIFVNLPEHANATDSANAWHKINLASEALRQGRDFTDVALQFSEDPAVKTNKGVVGFVSVFALSYELENLAYQTPVGQVTKPVRSKSGLHILKILSERKALGKIRLAHILLAFPPGANEQVKQKIKVTADSLCQALRAGASFAEMATRFSADNLSYQTGGEIPVFGVGRYDPVFENAAFGLTSDGEISAPVLTEYGYHIIRRIARIPAPVTENKETREQLKQEISTGPRLDISKKELLQKIIRITKFRKNPINESALWNYTDSVRIKRPAPTKTGIGDQTILFVFPKKNITVKIWMDYITPVLANPMLSAGKSHAELMDQFVQAIAYDYYREHLEEYSPDFAWQLNEFRDGNLLFEIMQKKVWDRAGTDSLGLKKYYDAHKDKYWWQPGADAILFTCNSQQAAQTVKKYIQTDVKGWRALADSSNGTIQADSGRFEFTQLPMAEGTKQEAGQFTSTQASQTDNTLTFAYIVALHNDREPRNYKDARGFVMNDYQLWLEDNWIAELKKKYPVKVNGTVLKQLAN